MLHINDTMQEALTILGFPEEHLADQIAAFKAAQPEWTTWDDFLTTAGYTTGQINDRKMQYFTDQIPPV